MCLSEPSGLEMITCFMSLSLDLGVEKKELSRLQRLLERRDCLEFLNEPSDFSQGNHLPCAQLTVCGVFLKRFVRKGPVFAQLDTTVDWPGGQRNSGGNGQWRMSAERDRWMDEPERVDCEGGTDGATKKVTAATKQKHAGETRGNRVDGEERCSKRGQRRGGQIRVKKGLLTLAVSQAICVATLHVLLKGWSAGNTDIMVSTGKQGQAVRARHT